MLMAQTIEKKRFLKNLRVQFFFDRRLGCNFLSNRYDISHFKVPPQHFGTLLTCFLYEIITANTYCNIWRNFEGLFSLLLELLPLLYY